MFDWLKLQVVSGQSSEWSLTVFMQLIRAAGVFIYIIDAYTHIRRIQVEGNKNEWNARRRGPTIVGTFIRGWTQTTGPKPRRRSLGTISRLKPRLRNTKNSVLYRMFDCLVAVVPTIVELAHRSSLALERLSVVCACLVLGFLFCLSGFVLWSFSLFCFFSSFFWIRDNSCRVLQAGWRACAPCDGRSWRGRGGRCDMEAPGGEPDDDVRIRASGRCSFVVFVEKGPGNWWLLRFVRVSGG